MKQMLQINIHSYVSLITNSSSELFVCSTDKSVEVVKKVIEQLYSTWKGSVAEYTPEGEALGLWTGIFSEPTIAEYTFQWYQFPEELRDEFEKYNSNNFNSLYTWEDRTSHEKTTEFQRLLKKQFAATNTIRDKWTAGYKNSTELYEKDKVASSKMHKEINESEEKIWRNWNKKKFNSIIALLVWYLKENGVLEHEMPTFTVPKSRYKDYEWEGELPEKVEKLVEHFRFCEGWGITMNKGDILLNSASDNTIPYELFGAIESMFNAQRRHLG